MTTSLPRITARVDVDTQELLTKATAMLFEMPKKSCLSLLPTYGPALIKWMHEQLRKSCPVGIAFQITEKINNLGQSKLSEILRFL